MRLMFVYYLMEDAGSAQDIRNYTRAAAELGHEVVVYGPQNGRNSIRRSRDLESADAVIFVFEWTTELRDGDQLDLCRIVTKVPRHRRIVIDCDGAYNDAIGVQDDYNHREPERSRIWTETCECLSDQIFQPTLHPIRPNVRPFLFHAYDPSWEKPLDFSTKEFGMIYVGHSKFRWWPMKRVLRAIQPVRAEVGRIGIIGHGWGALPHWAASMQIEDYYYTEPAYLQELKAELIPPVASEEVIGWMSKAFFNPVIYRPLFSHLQLVTCRTFETPGANTIPLFAIDPAYVQEIYGDGAQELVLPEEHADEKILDLVRRPRDYADIVMKIRQRFAEKHSYTARVQELIEIVKGCKGAFSGGPPCA